MKRTRSGTISGIIALVILLVVLGAHQTVAQQHKSDLSIGFNTSHLVSPKLEIMYTQSLRKRLAAYVTGATAYEEAWHYAGSAGLRYRYPLGPRLTLSAGLGMRLNYFRAPGFAADGSFRITQWSVEAPIGLTYDLSSRSFLRLDYVPWQELQKNLSRSTRNLNWRGIRLHAGLRF